MTGRYLYEHEKEEFSKIVDNIRNKEYLKDFYAGLSSLELDIDDLDRISKPELKIRILNSRWTDEEMGELRQYYSRILINSRLFGGYILKIHDPNNNFTREAILEILNSNLYNSALPNEAGFEVSNAENLRFIYKIPKNHCIFDDEGLCHSVLYPISLRYRIDLDKKHLILEDGSPWKYQSALAKLRTKFPGLELKAGFNSNTDDPDEYNMAINNKFKNYIDYLKVALKLNYIVDNGLHGQNNSQLINDIFGNLLTNIGNSPEVLTAVLRLINSETNSYSLSDLQNMRVAPDALTVRHLNVKNVYMDTEDIDPEMIPDDELYSFDGGQEVSFKEYLESTGIEELNAINIGGKEDIFENKLVALCVRAKGRIIGIDGTLNYNLENYTFTLKHGVGFIGDLQPDLYSLKFSVKNGIESGIRRGQINQMYDRLRALYDVVFLS
uniref:Uncharacterized protein n=1 Tax=Methanococcus maripaludis (strain C6 / ATCC BAA-1332) TaxID=444158 RepID=A9A7X5_METM6